MKQLKHSDRGSGDDRQEILHGIPTAELSRVVGDFESEGAIVETERDADGSWTVTATFENRKSF